MNRIIVGPQVLPPHKYCVCTFCGSRAQFTVLQFFGQSHEGALVQKYLNLRYRPALCAREETEKLTIAIIMGRRKTLMRRIEWQNSRNTNKYDAMQLYETNWYGDVTK